jgi:tRNA 2-selenouridine synthase
VPGAINLPLERRTRLGQSIYKRRHSRPKIGAALVARNVTFGWIPLKDILAVGDRWCIAGVAGSGLGLCVETQIGWRAEVIDGGYQSYRKSC